MAQTQGFIQIKLGFLNGARFISNVELVEVHGTNETKEFDSMGQAGSSTRVTNERREVRIEYLTCELRFRHKKKP